LIRLRKRFSLRCGKRLRRDPHGNRRRSDKVRLAFFCAIYS
jgi:hypothetical protein